MLHFQLILTNLKWILVREAIIGFVSEIITNMKKRRIKVIRRDKCRKLEEVTNIEDGNVNKSKDVKPKRVSVDSEVKVIDDSFAKIPTYTEFFEDSNSYQTSIRKSDEAVSIPNQSNFRMNVTIN